MIDRRFRASFEAGLKPLGARLHRAGVTADHLTVVGMVMAAAAAGAIAAGALRGGLLLLILAGLNDVLDGAVAKSSGTASPRGSFFDSVADRLSDALLFGGVGWFVATTYGDHAALLPMACLAGAMLISYERAKAESLGFDARGGLMERAERFVVLGFGLLFDSLLLPVLWVMLALIVFTAVQRFVKVWSQAPATGPVEVRRRARRSRRAARRTSGTWRSRVRNRRE